jgi:hypothetical protein
MSWHWNVMKNFEENIEYCSPPVVHGIQWLEKYLGDILSGRKDGEQEFELCCYTEGFYALHKVNHPLVSEFTRNSNNWRFWDSSCLFESPNSFYYLAKMGLRASEYFEKTFQHMVKDCQTVSGCISSAERHTESLRALVQIEPNSAYTRRALQYFIQNYEDFGNLREISAGILALFEYDFHKYSDIIRKLGDTLRKKVSEKKYTKFVLAYPQTYTSLPLQALCYRFGSNDKSVKKHIDWLKKNQDHDGSWKNDVFFTANAVLSLISIGEGPKIPREIWEQKESLFLQEREMTKPIVVSTIPFSGKTEIKSRMKEMINNTTDRLWICSRFITEFWTDILNLKRDNARVDIRIITIPKKEATRDYHGNGKKFFEPAFDSLQRTLKGNFKVTAVLHARCIITDDAILISSADLTPEQLEKEFNLGVFTSDPEAVETSAMIFSEFWESI